MLPDSCLSSTARKTRILFSWEQCDSFARFFENFPEWLKEREEGAAGNEAREALLQEYDELFKGVNADVFIPLWASGEILLDGLSLEVIRFYHTWGYAPVRMDGNPPDYIGEQFRFFCHLYALAFRALERGNSPEPYSTAAGNFTEKYLANTARTAAAGMRRYSVTPLFTGVAKNLEDYSTAEFPGALRPGGLTPKPEWHAYAAYREGAVIPIPDEPLRLVKTAGRNNCGGKCAVQAAEEEGCVTKISADCGLVGEPLMRACARGLSYRETFLDSRRLRYPMARIGGRGEGRFRRISWDEAADITASEWVRIKNTYGPAARYVNYSTGVSAALRPDVMVKRLLNLDGGHLGYYNSYSSACARFTTPYIYGDIYSGNSIEDVLNTKLLILWGHNPRETIFGSERNYYLAGAKERGVRIVVIDPRQSDTVKALAAEWIGIRPSTDAALADAMAFVIWSEGLQDRQFMDTFCLGFDEEHLPPDIPSGESYRSYLFGEKDGVPKTPSWAEAITGVPAETIVRLAREYALTKPACLMPGLGPQRTGGGEQTTRTLAMLCCLTGNVGKSGGGAAGCGVIPGPPYRGYPVPPNPYPGRIPSFLWTRAVEQGRKMSPRDDGLLGVDKLDTDIKLI
ncbi:MAG: molybdopterin-dependent oxidoreductase, partial [Treponema sp.]|nr:molybdopterin-dependent oxidoreductase [Treponema sp.]